MTQAVKKIHFLGICGTGMGALAEILQEKGYHISGSDQNVYPPMSDQLASLGISVSQGYNPQHIPADLDLLVVGNVIRKDNPELLAAQERNLPLLSMADTLYQECLSDKTSIVISGTHGKTTTTSLCAWLLECAQTDPGFFIGGVAKNFGKNARLAKGPYFVVEGDEYDSACFQKEAKFLHYHPKVLILTSIEFDHADIYKNLDHVLATFEKLISQMPTDGLLIANGDNENVVKLAEKAPCKVVYYSLESQTAEYRIENIENTEEASNFELHTPRGTLKLTLPLHGQHNIGNASAAVALLLELGIEPSRFAKKLAEFKGVKRRHEIVGTYKDIIFIDDFAHHPTEVKATIAAVRDRYPGRRLWAIFEPRSNTSRRNTFQQDYIKAFMGADRVLLAKVYNEESIPEEEKLDVQKIADILIRRGPDAHYIPDAQYLKEFVLRGISSGDVVLFMSNGDFGGIQREIFDALGKRRIITDPSNIKMGRVPKAKAAT